MLTFIKILLIIPVAFILSIIAIISIPIDKSGYLFRWTPYILSKYVFSIFGIKVTISGMENLDTSKPYVFVSNHASMFDIPAIFVSLKKNVNIIFKKELIYIPVMGIALRYGHFIMIDRKNPRAAMESIKRAEKSIKNGNSIILFPEGTRTNDGKLQPFKRGAFVLAIKAGAPIVPITINGTYKIMPKGTFNIKPTNISVVIEKPIEVKNINNKNDEIFLMETVHKKIEKHYINQ